MMKQRVTVLGIWLRGVRTLAVLTAVLMAAAMVAGPARAVAGDTPDSRYAFADLADQVVPSIVTVYVKVDMKKRMTPQERQQYEQFRKFFDDPMFRQFFGDIPQPQDPGDGEDEDPVYTTSSGSGVIISEDGYIVTNWHVAGDLEDKADIRVVLSDDTEISGDDVELIDSQDFTDLALIKIKTGHKLSPIAWGDSEKVRIGERVAAIGSPLDLRLTVTQGIVCAKHRALGGGAGDMIQTDAVINPGSSGGALVNLDGELIGINRMIATNTGRWQGYGFAIPVNTVREFAEEVIQHGKKEYGYIGILMNEGIDTPEMREGLWLDKDQKGVLVVEVTAGGPAEEAGVEVSDLITAVNGQAVTTPQELIQQIAHRRVGEVVKLDVVRGRINDDPKPMEIEVTLSRRPSQRQIQEARDRGLNAPVPKDAQEPEDLASTLGIKGEPTQVDSLKGLKITEIEKGSVSAKTGLRPGDVILQVNRQPVTSMKELQQAFEMQKGDRAHVMRLMRDNRQQLITLKPEKE